MTFHDDQIAHLAKTSAVVEWFAIGWPVFSSFVEPYERLEKLYFGAQ